VDFRDGILFVPEVLSAANAMKPGMFILLDKYHPDILGMSALLTTTMGYMKVVIDGLKEKGIRSDYVVLVGGAPLNEQFAASVGADAYCRDASVAVETTKGFMAKRQGSLVTVLASGS
jgi:methanogenic corrinoid protein MtbC1